MDHKEMRSYVLFHLHRNIDYWYELLGEFCEGTKFFTESYDKKIKVDGCKYTLCWCVFSGWSVT